MSTKEFPIFTENEPAAAPIQRWQIEGREWWLWGLAVVVTLVLTFGILSLTLPGFQTIPQLLISNYAPNSRLCSKAAASRSG